MHKVNLAPMMGYTNAPFRLLIRLLSQHAGLYTEMVTVNAIIHNFQPHYFAKFPEEQDVILQLGGYDSEGFSQAVAQAEQHNFEQININCGCPSNRVQNGKFGAILMTMPEQVANIVARLKAQTTIPITVKHRIGVDQQTDYAFVSNFVKQVSQAGCQTFIVHARTALLQGLSPRLNRKVPPLKPDIVQQLIKDFPHLNFCYNGGIQDLTTAVEYLTKFGSIMLGRSAWSNPYLFAQLESHLYHTPSPIRAIIVEKYLTIISPSQLFNERYKYVSKSDNRLRYFIKPLTNLYAHTRGAKKWRQLISTIPITDWQQCIDELCQTANQLEALHLKHET